MAAVQPGPAAVVHKHESFFWGFVQFQVEDVLYQLPTRPFIDGSPKFAERYGLVERTSNLTEKRSHPIIVLDVKNSDFVGFLQALLPPLKKPHHYGDYMAPDELGEDTWIAALDLSTRWSFGALRQDALYYFHSHWNLYPWCGPQLIPELIDMVGLARKYGVSLWLERGYERVVEALCEDRAMTLPEATRLGKDVALELQSLALERTRAEARGNEQTAPRRDIKDIPLVRDELNALREQEQAEHGSVWGGPEEEQERDSYRDYDGWD